MLENQLIQYGGRHENCFSYCKEHLNEQILSMITFYKITHLQQFTLCLIFQLVLKRKQRLDEFCLQIIKQQKSAKVRSKVNTYDSDASGESSQASPTLERTSLKYKSSHKDTKSKNLASQTQPPPPRRVASAA